MCLFRQRIMHARTLSAAWCGCRTRTQFDATLGLLHALLSPSLCAAATYFTFAVIGIVAVATINAIVPETKVGASLHGNAGLA